MPRYEWNNERTYLDVYNSSNDHLGFWDAEDGSLTLSLTLISKQDLDAISEGFNVLERGKVDV